MSSPYSKPQYASNNTPLHKSDSIHKLAANTLQKSHRKECEQFEQLSPISPIFDTTTANHHIFSKLGEKLIKILYKCRPPKNNSLFAQNSSTIKYSDYHSISSTTKMPRNKFAKPTPIKDLLTFLENSS